LKPEASLPKPQHLFIDNGGVITDNSLLGTEYLRLLPEFLVPRLGGTAEGWAEANRIINPGARERSRARLQAWDDSSGDVLQARYLDNLDWLRTMCAEVGVEGPRSDDDCAALAAEANLWVLKEASAAFPSAVEAVRQLAAGFTLFTASEGLSFQLAVHLGAYGIADLFERLYGPDFVNTPKQSPLFHERILAHASVDPATAVVVDDDPEQLGNAQWAGARTVLVNKRPTAGDGVDGVIAGLYQLPDLLRRL
jgi:HAD superfamily hydrolase (TIGR01509 family)